MAAITANHADYSQREFRSVVEAIQLSTSLMEIYNVVDVKQVYE